jgi:hypothetical protein
MGVQITIRPHVVRNQRGEEVEFDQFQILCGQRVCGYLGKRPSCLPKLVVKELPKDVLKAITRAAYETLRGLFPGEMLAIGAPVPSPAIGDQPARPAPTPADPAASVELEQALETSDEEQVARSE